MKVVKNSMKHPYTVYHPVALHLMSICHVSWGTSATTFDPDCKEQESSYQCWSFSSNGHPWFPPRTWGWDRVCRILPLQAHIKAIIRDSWSCDCCRGANSAGLFTLLISGVVTSKGTCRLTSTLHTHARYLSLDKWKIHLQTYWIHTVFEITFRFW